MSDIIDRSAEFEVAPLAGRRWRVFAEKSQVKAASALFDQQLWCWGRDVSAAPENLLLRSGLQCARPHEGTRASSAYSAQFSDGGQVILWGFGCFYGESDLGGVFLQRYGFMPLYTHLERLSTVYRLEELPHLAVPSTAHELHAVRSLLGNLLDWFAEYEHWIAESQGLTYRERCLKERPKKAVVPAQRMAREWELLAKKCRKLKHHRPSAPTVWEKLFARLRPSVPTKPKPRARKCPQSAGKQGMCRAAGCCGKVFNLRSDANR